MMYTGKTIYLATKLRRNVIILIYLYQNCLTERIAKGYMRGLLELSISQDGFVVGFLHATNFPNTEQGLVEVGG